MKKYKADLKSFGAKGVSSLNSVPIQAMFQLCGIAAARRHRYFELTLSQVNERGMVSCFPKSSRYTSQYDFQ